MTASRSAHDLIEAAIDRPWTPIETGHCSWRVRHDAHPEVELAITVQDGWLSMDAPVTAGATAVEMDDWNVLEKSGDLPRPWKAVRPAQSPSDLRVRAELAWHDADDDLPGNRGGALSLALEGFGNALAVLRGGMTAPDPALGDRSCPSDRNEEAAGRPGPGSGEEDAVDLVALLEDAGWPTDGHSSTVVGVPLPGRGGRNAQLRRDDGTLEVALFPGSLGGLSPLCLRATACLSLRVLGMVRLVRGGVVRDRAGEPELRLEVASSAEAGASELHHALSALSVASSLLAREMAFLGDEDAARSYLAAVAARDRVLVALGS